MATAARLRPEILSSLWVRMAQPLVDAAEHARQALCTRIIVSSPHCSGGLEEEVISAHLRNLGGGGGISGPG